MITFTHLLESLRKPAEIGKFRQAVSSITSVDDTQTSWKGTVVQFMELFGFRPLGDGRYGYVFGNPKYPYVIKVFMRDTAYLKWLDWAKRHQDNPYVPKIRGKVIKIGNLFMAVRLEKLSPGGTANELYDRDEAGDPHATQVVDFLEANNKLLDLHDGNVMLRGKQLVIVDPFFNYIRGGMFSIDPDDLTNFKNIL